jgi:hypothetical protein
VPCKHALGLLLVDAANPNGLEQTEPPDWVAIRSARPQPKQAPADVERAARDQAQRIRRREVRIQAGVDDLDRWLQDFARAGLAEMAARPWSTFEQMAARLVDAQAPGLARMVRDLGAAPHTHANWPERMLINVGRLVLLVEAWRARDALDPDLRAEVRSLVGIAEPRESVLAQPAVRDEWDIVGRRLLEGERMRVQRTWLRGATSKRWALILEFSAGGQPLDRTLLPGTRVDCELCFYPGVAQLRALVKSEPRLTMRESLPAAESVDRVVHGFAALLGQNPWLERMPAVVADVVPARGDEGTWHVVDSQQQAMSLGGDGWQLMALSGGQPIDVVGEWDGYRLWPLSVHAGGALIPLREEMVA